MFSSDPPPWIALIAPADKIQVVKMKEAAAKQRVQYTTKKCPKWAVEFSPLQFCNNICFLKSEQTKLCKAGVWDPALRFC